MIVAQELEIEDLKSRLGEVTSRAGVSSPVDSSQDDCDSQIVSLRVAIAYVGQEKGERRLLIPTLERIQRSDLMIGFHL